MGETRGDHEIAINFEDESSKPCIFEVPAVLRIQSPTSFTPLLFSIGPLHYKKEYLKEQKKAEKIKQHYLNNLLTRKPTPQTTLEDFKRIILEVEEKARQCYDVPFVHISKDEFVDMLVLDGCFIIEFLRSRNKFDYNSTNKDDPVFGVNWVHRALIHDLILLENQIPWFVLVRLFDMTSPTMSGSTESLTQLALQIFVILIFSIPQSSKIEGTTKHNHILDFIRNVLVSSQESSEKSSHKSKHIPIATKKEKKDGEWVRYVQLLPSAGLKESGIWFKKVECSNLMNITFAFKHGVLKIPYLVIGSFSCIALRNLVSYEQCYPYCEARITSYSWLLNYLITTPKDIEVLREAGIVDSWLNPSDAVEFFKNLSTDTAVNDFYYAQICRQVNEYTDRRWPRFRAAYMRMFRDPIGCLSLFAAAIALILTLLQTLYTMMQYHKDSSPSLPPPS